MRILRVAQDVFPDVVGGAPYHIHALSRDQATMGHDVTVLTVSDDPSKPRTEETDGYTIVRQSPRVELFGNELFAGTLGFLRDADQYDVIHSHSHLFYSSNVAAAFGRVVETPLAVTCHGLNSQRVPGWFSRLHLHTIGRFTYNTADVTFCYTRVERDRLRSLGVSTDIRVVHNGIDTDRFSPSGSEYPRIAESVGPSVLFVGRLVEGKRPSDLLSAFESVLAEFPSARLFFCGDGPLQERLEREVERAGISHAITFLDRVPYRKMPSVYRAADLFAITSRTEGFPRTVMEALACGTPVVSTRLEQTAPIVEQAGETVPVGDRTALAEAICSLLNDDDRCRQLSSVGRDIVAAEYDWSETVARTTRTLRDLTRSVPPRRTLPGGRAPDKRRYREVIF